MRKDRKGRQIWWAKTFPLWRRRSPLIESSAAAGFTTAQQFEGCGLWWRWHCSFYLSSANARTHDPWISLSTRTDRQKEESRITLQWIFSPWFSLSTSSAQPNQSIIICQIGLSFQRTRRARLGSADSSKNWLRWIGVFYAFYVKQAGNMVNTSM